MDAKAAFAIKTTELLLFYTGYFISLDDSSLQILLLICPQNKYEN